MKPLIPLGVLLLLSCGAEDSGASRSIASSPEAASDGSDDAPGADAGTDAPSQLPSGDGSAAGDPSPLICDDAELALACGDAECGFDYDCGRSCGQCADGTICEIGTCVSEEAFCQGNREMCECLSVNVSVPTRQSCSISVADGTEIDGEGFIDVDGERHRVLAINRWGDGHLIAWCDASTASALLASFEALAYLGQGPMPRFASFGRPSMCDPDWGVQQFEVAPTFLGAELPAEYLGMPERLAADWDVIMLCGAETMWDPGWPSLLELFVTEEGKGLLVVMDYQGVDFTTEDFGWMNSVVGASGISFDPVSLQWADASVDVGIDCLPDLTPSVLE